MNLEVIGNTARRPRVSCAEKLQLRRLYQEALKRRDDAINDMLPVRGKVCREEYERLRALADYARAALNLTRRALEGHKQDHGC